MMVTGVNYLLPTTFVVVITSIAKQWVAERQQQSPAFDGGGSLKSSLISTSTSVVQVVAQWLWE